MCPPLTLIDLFSGCGGASVGFKEAGFKIVAAVDIDRSACESYAMNVGVQPIEGDLRNVTGEQILKQTGLERGEVDVVVGCPPCQGFSSLRRTRKGDSRDHRDDLLMMFARRIAEIFPRMVIFENVPGIMQGRGKAFLRKFIKKLERHGYFPIGKLLDAANFGVPQHRKRLIIIFTREEAITGDLLPILPWETHADPHLARDESLLPWVTVRDSIADLPPLKSGEKHPTIPLHEAADHGENALRIIKNIPKNGGSRKSLPSHLWLPCHKKMRGRGAESVYGRMVWLKPSATITSRCTVPACGRFIHPDQDRGITPREAARLQSFDDNCKFDGSKESITWQIGNAMPPTLATAIGTAVHPQEKSRKGELLRYRILQKIRKLVLFN
ncbi:MAG: DNA cytosine methyltransferase [Candidatus Bathyarchaeota archaeon]|nr:DNA cytosine methyltransferase [Candidatus Bathyarchaeota archaeon]